MLDPLDELFAAQSEQSSDNLIFSEAIRYLSLAPPVCLGPNATVREAVQCMNDHHIGAVLITEDGAPVGIFTERDVLRRVTLQQLDLRTTIMRDVMTANPITITLNTTRGQALQRMLTGGFRHICVVEAGQAVGIFSLRDLAECVTDLFPTEVLGAANPGRGPSF
jgi:CBS domain-containing protein